MTIANRPGEWDTGQWTSVGMASCQEGMGQLAVRKHIGQTQESGYSCMGQLAVRKINKNKAKVK